MSDAVLATQRLGENKTGKVLVFMSSHVQYMDSNQVSK